MHTAGPRRVAFYSHDSQGLGHVRRNVELAAALVRHHPRTEVLLIGSAAGAERIPLPPRTALRLVPGVTKGPDGSYAAAAPGADLHRTLARRGRAVAGLLRSFSPDLFVVDKLARGLGGELDDALRLARSLRGPAGLRTRVVLGLRDVLDAPEVARREWDAAATSDTVLSCYDEVWVYGDPDVYDPVREYRLPSRVAERVRYTGYLARGRAHHRSGEQRPDRAPGAPYVLCLVGGGQDGGRLATAFARAPLPRGHRGVVVTGPQMADADVAGVRAAAADRPDVVVHCFVRDPAALLERAAAVVSMGGYNSVCEVLAARSPALVVPRVRPRREQEVRAESLARATFLETLHPELATPASLGAWLAQAVGRPVGRHTVDLDGLSRVPLLADSVLTPQSREVTRAGA